MSRKDQKQKTEQKVGGVLLNNHLNPLSLRERARVRAN
jgi:hypothetical protein